MNYKFDKRSVDLLIIQGSPFCNISCTYCYLPDRHLTKKVTPEIISKLFFRLIESDLINRDLTIVWHAGEPTALPIQYYEQIFDIIESNRPRNIKFDHSFQTNATLITQEWCDFIKKSNIKIGVSLDGPKHIHDKYRIKRNGKGSFDDAMKGVEFLRLNNIDFHIISVVTQDSLDYPDEIFDFFLDMGIQRLGFNIEEKEGNNKSSSINSNQEERVFNFLKRMFELQKAADGKIVIREFDSAFNKIMGNPFLKYNAIEETVPKSHLNVPYGIISVDCDGNFTTFSPELLGQKSEKYNDFKLGSVNNYSFKEAMRRPEFLKMYNDIHDGIKICSDTCNYFKVCGGGAPSNKYYENGTFKSAETVHCKYSVQFPINIVLDDMENELLKPGIKI